MSFLPYDRSKDSGWYSSIFVSGVAHAGLAALLTVGAIPFLPKIVEQEDPLADVFVSLEIISVDSVPILEPVFDENLIDPNEAVIEFEEIDPEISSEEDFESLEPTEEPLSEEDILSDENATLPIETAELAEQLEEDAVLPSEDEETVGDEVEILDETIADTSELIEPQGAEIVPLAEDTEAPIAEVVEEAEVVAEVIEAEVVEPTQVAIPVETEDDLAIEQASLVADAEQIISPLAEGSGGGIITGEPILEEDQLAMLLPENSEEGPAAIPLQDDAPTAVAFPEEPDVPLIDEVTDAEQIDDIVQSEDAQSDQTGISEALPSSSKGQVVAQPSAQALLVAQVIRGIRNTQPATCTLALPRRTGDGGVALSLVGETKATLDTLANSVLQGIDSEVLRSVELVDSRQCAVLDALRQIDSYPATRIGISIDNIQLKSGDDLSARILGAGGLFVTAVVVDDNGVVQTLDRFSTIDDGDIAISAPISRAGPIRDTRQLLLAIGSSETFVEIEEIEGELAQRVFSGIPLEQLKASQFSLVTFDLQ